MIKVKRKIDGEIKNCIAYTADEIAEIFDFDDEDWHRKFKSPEFLKKAGLNSSPNTFLTAGSIASNIDQEGAVAGICLARYDSKDEKIGHPVNSQHYDFVNQNGEILVVTKNNKSEKHWFKSPDEWKEELKKNPPHEKDIVRMSLKIDRRKNSEGWTYFLYKEGERNKELASVDVYFLDNVTSVYCIINNTYGKIGYIKGLGEDLFNHIRAQAIKKGHKAIIAEWIDRDGLGGEKGWNFFVEKKNFKLMKEQDYKDLNFTRDKHEGHDYFSPL